MVIWGGWDASVRGDGALYDPATDSWSPMALADAPKPRQRFAFAASDRCLFVWGGGDAAGAPLDTGAVWCGGPPPCAARAVRLSGSACGPCGRACGR